MYISSHDRLSVSHFCSVQDTASLVLRITTLFPNSVLVFIGPCHHGMACPPFAEGGEGLRIWMIPANKFSSSRGQLTGVVLQLWVWVRGWQQLGVKT